MFCNLGLPAIAAAAHTHEFSSLHESAMVQEPYFSLPIQYLQSRLQAFSNIISSSSQTVTPPESNRSNLTNNGDGDYQDTALDLSAEIVSTADHVAATKAKQTSVSKTKTAFHLAHPPPITKHKHRFKVRPKLLLQLQQISDTHRPRPALDVLPSVVFAPRLARRFPRILNGRTGLGPDDLIIVKSQTYDHSHTSEGKADDSSDGEDWDSREVVAAICLSKKRDNELHGQTEIYLSQGPRWLASPSGNGGYDFICHDENEREIRARWVSKSSKHRRMNSNPNDAPQSTGFDEKTFKFSMLMPDARRHPVIASMDRKTICISDQYSIPDTPIVATTPASNDRSSTAAQSSQSSYFHDIDNVTQTLIDTDERLKTLIIVTGVWVAFAEGWSENFKYSNDMGSSKVSVSTASPSKSRVFSSRLDIGAIEGRVPTPQSFSSAKSRHGSLNIIHRSATSVNMITQQPLKSDGTPQRANSSGPTSVPRAVNHHFPTRPLSQPSSLENLVSDRFEASSPRHKKASSVSTSHGPSSIKELVDLESSDIGEDETGDSIPEDVSPAETNNITASFENVHGKADQRMKKGKSGGAKSRLRRSGTLRRFRGLFSKKSSTN